MADYHSDQSAGYGGVGHIEDTGATSTNGRKIGTAHVTLDGGTAPTGSATAAKQDTGNTSLASIDTNVGAKADSAATTDTGTFSLIALVKRALQSLTTLISQTASVVLASQGYSASVTLTRTNDTNAYAANDVIGAATGSTAALTFASMGPSAGRILITSVSLEIDASAIISGETSYTLHLYDVTPPSASGDNAAWDLPSGDRASYLGFVNLGTPVDLGSTLYVEANIVNKQVKLAGTSLFAYLVTVGAHTPTAQRVYVVKLHAVSL